MGENFVFNQNPPLNDEKERKPTASIKIQYDKSKIQQLSCLWQIHKMETC